MSDEIGSIQEPKETLIMVYRNALLAATAFVIAAGFAPASAEAADGVALHSGTLRAGPASDYPAVDHISNGESLQIFGCTDGYQWCDVEGDGNRGWFAGSRIGFIRDGRRELLPEVGVAVGIGIVAFSVDEYWGAHYHDRPFFVQKNRWINRGPVGHGPVVHGPVVHGPVVHGPVSGTPPHQPQFRQHPNTPPVVHNPPVIHNNHPAVIHNNPPVVHNTPHVNATPHPHAPACPDGKCH